VKELWTFTFKEKLDKFITILTSHEIEYEILSSTKNKHVVSVSEQEYVKAKRILLKHRERRTSGDSINSNNNTNS